MTDWQPEFITLGNQGLEVTEIAQRLGIPPGTVKSRAHRLQQQGTITSRGRGGVYPRQKALARQAGASAVPATSVPLASPVAPTLPAVTCAAVPEIQEMLGMLKTL
jgi:DNA-binding IclR family transcriptional regulator